MSETEMSMSRRGPTRTLAIRAYVIGSDRETTDLRRRLLRRIDRRLAKLRSQSSQPCCVMR